MILPHLQKITSKLFQFKSVCNRLLLAGRSTKFAAIFSISQFESLIESFGVGKLLEEALVWRKRAP